jgi:Flp pilus assembly protein CpaB
MRRSHKLAMLGTPALLLSCSAIRDFSAVKIPPGMRAVGIHVHVSSVAPDDHVNVLMINKAQTRIILLENVIVMAVDQKVGVVTLLVSPEDAQQIMDAGEQGEI